MLGTRFHIAKLEVGDSATCMQDASVTSSKQEPTLIGVDTCLKTVFPDPKGRPSKRTFLEWKARRYFPSMKIGKRVFVDPVQVRKALDKRFTVEAID